jgi:hypothetical protein
MTTNLPTQRHVSSKMRRKMTQRARIYTPDPLDGAAPADSWGQPPANEPRIKYDALPCLVVLDSPRGDAGHEIIDGQKNVAVASFRIRIPMGSNVTTADTVEGVYDRLGRLLVEGPLQIWAVQYRPDHIQLKCQQILSGKAP